MIGDGDRDAPEDGAGLRTVLQISRRQVPERCCFSKSSLLQRLLLVGGFDNLLSTKMAAEQIGFHVVATSTIASRRRLAAGLSKRQCASTCYASPR